MVKSLWNRLRRVSPNRKLAVCSPCVEPLESRVVLSVSNIIPGTLLSGPTQQSGEFIPPVPEGAIGTDFLVSVVNNRIQWRRKDGTTNDLHTIDAGNLFGQQLPVDALTGATIVNPTTGLQLLAWDPNGGRGVAFDNAANTTQQALTVLGGGYDAGNGNGAFGMRVQYDQYLGRFIIMAENNQANTTSQIFVAVSIGEDPNAGFNLLSIQSDFAMDPDGFGVDPLDVIPHYVVNVQFGVTFDSIVITGNGIGNTGNGLIPDDARVWVVQKQQYYEGGATTVTRSSLGLGNMRDGGSGLFHYNLKPVHNYGESSDSAFIIETFAGSVPGAVTNRVDIYRIDNVNEDFWTDETGLIRVPPRSTTVGGLSVGFDLPTNMLAFLDSTAVIEVGVNDFETGLPGDSRDGNVVFGNFAVNGSLATPSGGVVPQSAVFVAEPDDSGFGRLWFSHTLDGADGRPDVRWYEIRTATDRGAPSFVPGTLLQQGGVNANDIDVANDPAGVINVDTSNSEITVNGFNDMAISFAASNEVTFLGAYYSARFDVDRTDPRWGPVTNATTRPAKALQEGLDAYYRQVNGSGAAPWGWTSGIGFDPVDQDTFWAFNAYAGVRPPGNVFGIWQTTWGAFKLVADTQVIMVDVSDSMGAIKGQDVDGDGRLTNADDANNDGLKGDLIDYAIFKINALLDSGLLPGQPGNLADGRIVLVIFARDTQVIVLNPTATGDARFRVQAEDDFDQNGQSDLRQAVDSMRVGSATFVNKFVVRTDRSNYCPPIEDIAGLSFGATRIVIYSDGSGRFDPACNIPAGTRIDTVKLGPYQTIGDTTGFDTLAFNTSGTSFSENNPGVPQDGGFTNFGAVDRLPGSGFPFNVTYGPDGSSARNGIYGPTGPYGFVFGQPLNGGIPGAGGAGGNGGAGATGGIGGGVNERAYASVDVAAAIDGTTTTKSRRTNAAVAPSDSLGTANSKAFVSISANDENLDELST